MALFGQDRPDAGAVELGAVLGDLITGGPDRRAQANMPKRMGENFDSFYRFERAGRERARRAFEEGRARNQAGITADRVQGALAGDQVALGELSASMLGVSQNPNLSNVTKGAQDLASMNIDREIRDALESGDVAAARRLSAIKNDRVLPELGKGGDVVFTPLDGSVETTALGESAIALNAARAAQAQAAAARSMRVPAGRPPAAPKRMPVQELKFHVERLETEIGRKLTSAELNDLALGRFAVSVPAGGGAALGDPPSPGAGADVMEQARGAIARGANPEAVKQRLRERGMADLAEQL